MSSPTGRSFPWLFSATTDLLAFLGSALLALGLLILGWALGWTNQETPDWLWIAAVVLIDVAHVYATAFRTYFDPTEFRRRIWLYTLVPLLAFANGAALYSEGHMLFWRMLAYLAVFHFVRQQYGWVALYRSRAKDEGVTGKVIDSTAIYLATIYPLVYWHCHPRNFAWFVNTDFAQIPAAAERILAPIYWAALGLYAIRLIYQGLWRGTWNPGKDIVVATTAICWYVGIVTFDSDYAFTVTNVIIHGIPYIVLVGWYRERRPSATADPGRVWQTGSDPLRESDLQGESIALPRVSPLLPQAARGRWRKILFFVSVLWVLAFAEELFWDCGIWHERSWLFGRPWDIGNFDTFLVPLLAIPQITHYILDSFIWRRRSNPEFASALHLPRSSA